MKSGAARARRALVSSSPTPTGCPAESDRSLLLTALVAARLPDAVPEARMLRAWLHSWSGAREVVEAMNGHGYDFRLSQSPFGWWAEFCRSRVR
jgi:hypothetical protein